MKLFHCRVVIAALIPLFIHSPLALSHGSGGGWCQTTPGGGAGAGSGSAGGKTQVTPSGKSREIGKPGAGPRGPGTGSGGAAPGVRGPTTGGGAATGRKRRVETAENRWEIWWLMNRAPYVQMSMDEARGRRSTTGSAAFLSGMAARGADLTEEILSPDSVREQIASALSDVLRNESHPKLLDAATVALGRITPSEEMASIRDDVLRSLKSDHASVRQAAIVSLGVCGHRSAAPILWAVMNDTREGRKLLGLSGFISSVDRAFASIALGFAASPEMAPQLIRLIERKRDDDAEVVAGALLALGMIKNAAPTSIPFLTDLLSRRKVDRRIRAQIPIALSRLGSRAACAVPALVEIARNRKSGQDLRRSCVIALGRLIDPEDIASIDVLRKLLRQEKDASVRNFTYIALARVGARAFRQQQEGTLRGDTGGLVHGHLVRELIDPDHAMDRSWVALSLGVLGHEIPQGSPLRRKTGELLFGRLKETRNPSEVGALAVALGLTRFDEAGDELQKRMNESSDALLQSHLALALGMAGVVEASDGIIVLLEKQKDAALKVEMALSLGLLGETRAVQILIDLLDQTNHKAVAASVAHGLGVLKSTRAVPALLQLARDVSRPAEVRDYAYVALGMVAEKTPLPWNTPLAIDSNYTLDLAAQYEMLRLL